MKTQKTEKHGKDAFSKNNSVLSVNSCGSQTTLLLQAANFLKVRIELSTEQENFACFLLTTENIEGHGFFYHESAILCAGAPPKTTEEDTFPQNNSVPSVKFRDSKTALLLQAANCREVCIELSTEQENFVWFFINHGKHRDTRKKTHFHRIIPWFQNGFELPESAHQIIHRSSKFRLEFLIHRFHRWTQIFTESFCAFREFPWFHFF